MRYLKRTFFVGVTILFSLCIGCSKEKERENRSNPDDFFLNSEDSYDITEEESTQPAFSGDETTFNEETFDEENSAEIESLLNLKKGWYVDGDEVVVYLPTHIYGSAYHESGSGDDDQEDYFSYPSVSSRNYNMDGFESIYSVEINNMGLITCSIVK